VLAGACGGAFQNGTEKSSPTGPAPKESGPPRRIVSLDYCADNYVLGLADRERILAVSPDAAKSFTYMREAAVGIQTVRPTAEEVLSLGPDLVVRTYGGGAGAAAFFGRAGVPVLQLGYGTDLDAIAAAIAAAAERLRVPEKGAALVEAMERRLRAVKAQHAARLGGAAKPPTAPYVNPAGVTSGPGTLMHEVFEAAGAVNFQQADGYREIPLERLAYESPDLVASAFFGGDGAYGGGWSPARHPLVRRLSERSRQVPLREAWISCGGWFVLDAVEAVAAAAKKQRSRALP